MAILGVVAVAALLTCSRLPAQADASAREQWILKQLREKQARSGAPWPKAVYDRQRRFFEQLPSGTRVYPIPGVTVLSGPGEAGTFFDCTYARRNERYVILRGGKIVASFPRSAHVLFDRELGAWYVEPGKTVPKRYAGEAPIDIVP